MISHHVIFSQSHDITIFPLATCILSVVSMTRNNGGAVGERGTKDTVIWNAFSSVGFQTTAPGERMSGGKVQLLISP